MSGLGDLPVTMAPSPVYKILTPSQWGQFQALGLTWGSQDDRRDGFIHLSAGHQVAGTLAKHFAMQTIVWIAAVDAVALGEALKWEPSRAGQVFPHLYAPLQLWAIRSQWSISKSAEGWALPAEIAHDR